MRTGCATCAVRETRTENSTSLGSSMAPAFCRGPQADGASSTAGRRRGLRQLGCYFGSSLRFHQCDYRPRSVAQGEYLVLQARVGDRTGTPKCPRASCGVAVVRVRIGVRAVLSLSAHQVLLLRPQREELSVGTKS